MTDRMMHGAGRRCVARVGIGVKGVGSKIGQSTAEDIRVEGSIANGDGAESGRAWSHGH